MMVIEIMVGSGMRQLSSAIGAHFRSFGFEQHDSGIKQIHTLPGTCTFKLVTLSMAGFDQELLQAVCLRGGACLWRLANGALCARGLFRLGNRASGTGFNRLDSLDPPLAGCQR